MYPCHKTQNYLKNSEYDANPNDWLIDWLNDWLIDWIVSECVFLETLHQRPLVILFQRGCTPQWINSLQCDSLYMMFYFYNPPGIPYKVTQTVHSLHDRFWKGMKASEVYRNSFWTCILKLNILISRAFSASMIPRICPWWYIYQSLNSCFSLLPEIWIFLKLWAIIL